MSNYLTNHFVLVFGSVVFIIPVLVGLLFLIEIKKSRPRPFIKKGLRNSEI